jgi:hypothetical protein
MIGAISAAENMTDVQANQTEPVVLEESPQEEIAENINVTFEEQMWEENLSDITVELPEEASGEFCLKVGDDVIYNQTITNKSFKVPVKLTKPRLIITDTAYPPVDCRSYKVSAFYNGMDLNINRTLKIMRFSPDYNLLGFPEEVLQYGNSQFLHLMFPRSANGYVEIYLNGRLLNASRVKGSYLYVDFTNVTSLPLGDHTIRFVYYNDTYYHDVDRTFNFTVVNAKISIPKTIYINHDTCVSVDVLDGVQGTVKVYVDGKLVRSEKYEKYYVFSLEDCIKWNSSVVTVEFTSKEFSRSKTQNIMVKYDLEVYSSTNYIYGQDNVIELYLPDNLNNNLLNVEINGVKYKFTHPENIMNNILEVDISKLDAGNYTMFISYSSDDVFVAKNNTFNFTVRYDVIYPGWNVEYKDQSEVVLDLPANASGTFNLYLDGVLFKSVRMNKGHAAIKLTGISEGYHALNATYVGDDYHVEPSSYGLQVGIKVNVDYRFAVGEDKYVSVEVSKDAKGYVIFEIDGRKHNVTVKNGIAKISLKDLKIGEHDVDIDYYGDDGFTDYSWKVVTVYKPKIRIVSAKLYTTSVHAKIKVLNNNNKPIKNARVTVKLNGKSYVVKTDKKGIATLKKALKLKSKKYALAVSYNGAKASKTLKAKKVLSLKAVRKSGKKVTLVATLKEGKSPIKSKTVSFKFNGKNYKARTNSKGIAKVTVDASNLKAGKKVAYQATYIKDAVKKTLKV